MTWRLTLLMPLLVLFLVLSAWVFDESSGKEAGRIPFTRPGTGISTIALRSGEVAFWTDLDVHYEGDAPLSYHVELAQAGHDVASAECDPLASKSITWGWSYTSDGVSQSESGRGKMQCTATLPAAGPTTIRATLVVNEPGRAVTLKKADLVLKQ